MAVIEVDFTGVESSGGFLAPGAYEAQVQNIELRDGRNYPGLKFTWVSTESDTNGQRADQFVSLAPKALWKFKGILEAFGAEIPQSLMRFDTDRLIGKRAVIRVIDEPWTDAEGVTHSSSKVDTVHPSRADKAPQAKPSDLDNPLPPEPVDMAEDEDIPF